MTLPLRLPSDGGAVVPTASFASLLAREGMLPSWDAPAGAMGAPEATTILALRWADGVLMAGDRRATAGNVIAHRRVKTV